MKSKNLYVIAGPNGSGKTTFAMKFMPEFVKCPNFVNADLIAKGLAPFDPERAALKAGKLVLQQLEEYSRQGVDFGFETTLSGRAYYKKFKQLKDAGYRLHLFFLWIPSSELAIARIKERVAGGGHNIPDKDVKRRFNRGMKNFLELYNRIFDTWMLFDNSGLKPALIAKNINGVLKIIRKELYKKIQNQGEE